MVAFLMILAPNLMLYFWILPDNCSKIITESMKTTANHAVLKDVSFVKLNTRREK